MRTRGMVCGLGAVLLLSACSGAQTGAGSAATTVRVTTAPTSRAAGTVTEPPAESTTATPPAATTSSAPVLVAMPDVVCKNLQAAQDEIQEAGVFFSRSDDATGAGRRQILDRDWIVVSQKPDPGVPIGEGDATLSVVRTSEPNNC